MRLEGFVKKGWGSELIWATNDKYCGKLMRFNTGSKFSLHFHKDKEETWYVLDGLFFVKWIDTDSMTLKSKLFSLNRHDPISYKYKIVDINEAKQEAKDFKDSAKTAKKK